MPLFRFIIIIIKEREGKNMAIVPEVNGNRSNHNNCHLLENSLIEQLADSQQLNHLLLGEVELCDDNNEALRAAESLPNISN